VAGYLVSATSEPGEDYHLLENMHNALIGQWRREMGHVANVVGGGERINFYFGDADRRYFPIEAARQKEAVAFLNEHAFRTPKLFLDPEVLGRIEADGVSDRVLAAQRGVLSSLLSDGRIKRMGEMAADGETAYTAAELLRDVSDGVWSELADGKPSIGLYRRNLQRAYVELLAGKLESEDPASDLPALARGELVRLQETCSKYASTAADEVTSRHLEDVAAQMKMALEQVKVQGSTGGNATGNGRRPR